jgi:hypothetical protein
MTDLLELVACFVAVVAAVRSTWSPCGLSMLATITPLAERGRGHRYRSTAAWFVTGSVLGGASLGAMTALFAVGIGALNASTAHLAAVATLVCAVTIAADMRIGGFQLPAHRRQVNERWLDQFRPWVYGAGFGWQIGAGLATYVKTYAVYLLIVLAALTGNPALAVLVGVVFGLVRGLTVFLGRHISSSAALSDFHRRFVAAGPLALTAVVVAEGAATLTFAAVVSPWLVATVAVGLSVATTRWALRRHHRKSLPTAPPVATGSMTTR